MVLNGGVSEKYNNITCEILVDKLKNNLALIDKVMKHIKTSNPEYKKEYLLTMLDNLRELQRIIGKENMKYIDIKKFINFQKGIILNPNKAISKLLEKVPSDKINKKQLLKIAKYFLKDKAHKFENNINKINKLIKLIN